MYRKIRTVALILVAVALAAAGATAASSPSVSTGGTSHVTQTSADLLGTINPNGSKTSYYFEWGLTNSYGVTGHTHSAGNGTKPVTAKASPTGLIPGTVYHYRLIGSNRYGTSTGRDRTFKTTGHPPAGATTGPPTNPTTGGVTLTGVIAPNGASTDWAFQYGLTTSYTSQTNLGTVAASSPPVIIAYPLSGLAPGTIFHYRLVAYHGSLASYGADQIFMTEPSPAPKPRLTTDTRPRHARTKPFVFTTRGRVIGPSTTPAQFDCTGAVAVRFTLSKRTVAYFLAPVQPDCTYSAQMTFNHKPGHGAKNRKVKLVVAVRFHGNGYIAPVQGHYVTVTLG